MESDWFKELERMFHELSDLSEEDRVLRLQALRTEDSEKAAALDAMLESLTRAPAFLNPDSLGTQALHSITIPMDGTARVGDRFTLLERIGTGGTSTVFRAHDEILNRDVAIKMLRCGLISDSMRARFESESKTLASLTHPHIAHVYQAGVSDHQGEQIPWIAMEFVRGSKSVIDYVQERDLPVHDRVALFLAVCDAIQASHNAGILHLDLNASNILVDPHGYPKIIDFGLFEVTNAGPTGITKMVGTRTSMAPEQTVYHTGKFDERTDVYALGLLLVHLLVGVRLQVFENMNAQEACRMIAVGKPAELLEELGGIDPAYRAVIRAMIRVNPDDRIATVARVAEQVRAASHTSAGMGKPVYTRRAVPALIVLAVVLVIAGYTFQSSPPSPSGTQPVHPKQDTIQIPSDVVIDAASANPRTSSYSEQRTMVINRLAAAIESDTTLAPLELARMHASLADHYRIAGRYAAATRHFKLAAELYRANGEPELYNYAVMSLIKNHIFLEQYDLAQEALDRLDRSIQLSEMFLVDLSIAEAQILLSTGDVRRADRQASYTQTLLDTLPPSLDAYKVERLQSQSAVYVALSRSKEASEALDQARRLAERSFPPNSSDIEIARIKAAIGPLGGVQPVVSDDAGAVIRQSIEHLEAAGDQFHAAWAMRQLGHWHYRRGQYEQASGHYRAAYNAMARILGPEHHETIRCRVDSAICERALHGMSGQDNERFRTLMDALSEALGAHHSMLASYKSTWAELPE